MKRWDVLNNLIKKNQFKRGAEIGVAYGQNLFNVLDANKELTMVAVDIWQPVKNVSDPGPNGLYGYPKVPHELNEQRVMAKAPAYGDRLKIIKMESVIAANMIRNASLDFVFIDACHAQQEVEEDIKAWFPKVKKGGCILGHDIHYESVEKAVLNTLGAFIVLPDDCWCYDA